MPLFLLPIFFYDLVVETKDKKHLYYAIAIQLLAIFTFSGIVLGFFSGLTWKDQFGDLATPANSTCIANNEDVLLTGLPYYLTGIIVYIISIILVFVIVKLTLGWMKRIEEVERE